MALFTKSDLKYEYSWTALSGDNPKITGEPDSTLLNRNEGYEMLYFINKFAEKNRWQKKSSGEILEKMIKEKVPSDIRSQVNIERWIKENW